MSQKGFTPILVLILIATLTGIGGYFVYQRTNKTTTTPPSNQAVCTLDAKLCPDGTYVSRTGLKCEFSLCPTPKESTSSATPSDLKIYINSKWGYQISYQPTWTLNNSSKDNIYLNNQNQVIQIIVKEKTKSTLADEAKIQGQTYPQCSIGGTCNPIPAKEVINKSDAQFDEYYEVTDTSDRKILVLPFPNDLNHIIVIRQAESKFIPAIPIDTLNQILSTFKFLP